MLNQVQRGILVIPGRSLIWCATRKFASAEKFVAKYREELCGHCNGKYWLPRLQTCASKKFPLLGSLRESVVNKLFFLGGVVINTTAYYLGRCSLYLLLLNLFGWDAEIWSLYIKL